MAWKISPVAMVAVTACVVVAAAGSAMILQPDSQRRGIPASKGPGVSISVVDPKEPVLTPGGVMEVGELSDGYEHRRYSRPADYQPLPYDDFEAEPPVRAEPRRMERPREVVYEPAPPPVIVERRERPRRWPFGFDQPRPDYAAERRERMARLEDQRRVEEERMRYRSAERDERPDWRDDGRGGDVDRRDDRRGERQWYRSDGSRVPAPDTLD